VRVGQRNYICVDEGEKMRAIPLVIIGCWR